MDKDRVESLNHFLAENVMGWVLSYDDIYTIDVWLHDDETFDYAVSDDRPDVRRWNPYYVDAQAAMVRRRMVELGWDYEVYCDASQVMVLFRRWTGPPKKEHRGLGEAPTEAAATCEAAAKALES